MIDFLFPDLSSRSEEKELMDLADCDTEKLLNTVKQFEILNFLFTSSRRLINKYIIKDIVSRKVDRIFFLDIGAGGCDIDIWFLKQCKKIGIKPVITCLDFDERIVGYAKKKCEMYEEISVVHGDAFGLANYGKFDYVFANHFLHHLDEKKIPIILELVNRQCNRLFLINDIKRSNLSYLGYTFFTGIFFHNSFAFYDGRLSIKKGFLSGEMKEILDKSGLADKINVSTCIPSRVFVSNK